MWKEVPCDLAPLFSIIVVCYCIYVLKQKAIISISFYLVIYLFVINCVCFLLFAISHCV